MFQQMGFACRLIWGQTLLSYGLHCALLAGTLQNDNYLLMQGVHEEVVKRAAIVLDAFESNHNIDKLNLDNISSQDQAFKDDADKFLELEISKGVSSVCFLPRHVHFLNRSYIIDNQIQTKGF